MNELPGLLVPEHVLACPFCGGTDISYICFVPVDAQQPKKDAGAKTIDGVEMFVRQGAESLKIWGYEPPLKVMREAVLDELMKN